MKTITFIGNGNMALSIAKGLKANYKIEVVGRSLEKLNKFENELGIEIEKALMDDFDINSKTFLEDIKRILDKVYIPNDGETIEV